MTSKDAIYRELKYALAGVGGGWAGLIEQSNIKMDVRITFSSGQGDDAYPFVIFRRVTGSEDNQVRYSRERFEIELIGLQNSATKGDDLIEQMKNALIDHFSGKHKTWGKFDANGNADSNGGLKMKAVYLNTVDLTEFDTKEKCLISLFAFAHIRE